MSGLSEPEPPPAVAPVVPPPVVPPPVVPPPVIPPPADPQVIRRSVDPPVIPAPAASPALPPPTLPPPAAESPTERRLDPPELSVLLRGGGAAALLILMFATSWFGLSTAAHGAFGAARSSPASAWDLLRIERWWLLGAAAAGVLSLMLPVGRIADAAMLIAGIATAVLFYRLLINPPDPHAVLDIKLGAYLALVAAAALTLGAYEAPATPAPPVQ